MKERFLYSFLIFLCCFAERSLQLTIIQPVFFSSALSAQTIEHLFIKKNTDPNTFRLMTWNVKVNSILEPDGSRIESFNRIVKSMKPDVVILQEVFDEKRVNSLIPRINKLLPQKDNQVWVMHTANDNVILSHYPIIEQAVDLVAPYPFPERGWHTFNYGQGMALLKLPDDHKLFLLAIHNKSGASKDNVRLQQLQSDSVVKWLRENRDTDILPTGTPMIIAGDINVLATNHTYHLDTLITGNIRDEKTFGKDIKPDWDGTELADVYPSINGKNKQFYTWRIDNEPFPPGALSRVLYTDSLIKVEKSFVIDTTQLTATELLTLNLEKKDVLLNGIIGNYDHLPIVVDFSFK